jgi:alkanesulfonate monooxygenase SsuD/methylene tetrahydromethanopterin reductase-like flavin-dependent oxidoreductase (luciferase family)
LSLLQPKERLDRLDEGLAVISNLLCSDQPVTFSGKYFQVNEAILLPKPSRPGGPPILVGGNGINRTMRLAARYAQEWNALLIPPQDIARLNAKLDEYILQEGRKPKDVRRSLMTGCVFGVNEAEVDLKVRLRTNGQRSADELRQRGLIVGTADQIVEQCQQLADIGVYRVMLQWLDLDDISGLENMAKGVLDRLQA